MTARRNSTHDRVLGSVDDEPFDAADATDDLAGLDLASVGAEVRALIESYDAEQRRERLASADAGRRAALAGLLGRAPEPRRSRADLQAELRRLATRGGQLMLQQYQMKFEDASDEDLVRMIAEAKHALGED